MAFIFIEEAKWSIIDKSLDKQLPKVVVNDVPVIHFVCEQF